jgi:hypothetical protein
VFNSPSVEEAISAGSCRLARAICRFTFGRIDSALDLHRRADRGPIGMPVAIFVRHELDNPYSIGPDMKNPWMKKNPFLSMWLSGANAVAVQRAVTRRRRRSAGPPLSGPLRSRRRNPKRKGERVADSHLVWHVERDEACDSSDHAHPLPSDAREPVHQKTQRRASSFFCPAPVQSNHGISQSAAA